MEVSLEPHTGVSLVDKTKTVDHQQYRVRVDGVTVGFVGFADNAPVNLTKTFPPDVAAMILDRVAELKNGSPQAVNIPPAVPPSLLAEPEELEAEDFD